jgi:hypothetical protein
LQIKDALLMYEDEEGSPFRFVHCWLLLRNENKWTSFVDPGTNGEAGEDSQPPIDDGTLPPRMEKPVGRDKAKKQRSGNASSQSSACLEVLQKMSMDQRDFEDRQEANSKQEGIEEAARAERKLQLQEEQLKVSKMNLSIQERMLALQETSVEQKVMDMDTEKMAPWVRAYYINLQKKISEKSVSADGDAGASGSH